MPGYHDTEYLTPKTDSEVGLEFESDSANRQLWHTDWTESRTYIQRTQ